jgi:hypothetical protein
MNNRSSDSVGAPIVLTLLSIAFGAFLWAFAGPDPFFLYCLTTPFVIVLLWLSRNSRVWDEAPAPAQRAERRAAPTIPARAGT